MALEGHDVCSLVWSLLVADAGPGGVNTLLGGTPTTPGRIYQDVVPQAAALPAATIGLVAAPDTNTLGGVHVMSTVDVDVRVVTSGTGYGPLVPIARRVNVVLDGAHGTNGESYAYRVRRIDFRRMPETDAGGSFRHLIGTYRTEAHPTP
jgi:Protein of unknown function (DUF3168)